MVRRNVRSVRSVRSFIENLESRLLMTGDFSNGQIAGEWAVAGMDVGGSLVLDALGAITGGSETLVNGNIVAGNGTYTLGIDGSLTLTTTEYTRSGNLNTTGDVFTISNTTDDFPLIVAVKHTGVFSNANAQGKWNFYTNSNDGASTGNGVVQLDNAGNITSGSFKTTQGTKSVTGSYNIDADGNMQLVLTVQGAGTFTFDGAMNDSKNVAALGSDDLADAATNGDARMVVLVKSESGIKYSAGDVKGAWTVSSDRGQGDLTFDGKGKFNGTLSTDNGAATVTGTYSVSTAGIVTMHVKAVIGPATFKYTLTAAIDSDKNEIVSVQTPTKTGALQSLDSMTLFTRSDNYAPTATKITPSTIPIVADIGKSYTLTQLLALMNEADNDRGDTLEVNVTAQSADVDLFVDNVLQNGAFTLHSGETLTIVPKTATAGKTISKALTLRVTDGTATSPTDVFVKVKSLKLPVVSVSKSGSPNELKGTTGKFTFTRSGGDLKSDLVVNYTVNDPPVDNDGSIYTPQLTGIVTIPAGKTSVAITITPVNNNAGPDNHPVTVTLTLDDPYTISPVASKQAATLIIVDPNRTPTINNTFIPIVGTINTNVILNYSALIGHALAVDPEAVAMDINLKNITGTLTIDGTPVVGTKAVVHAGANLVWTPPVNASGIVKMFDMNVTDFVFTTKFIAATADLS